MDDIDRQRIEAALAPFVRDVRATLDPAFDPQIRKDEDGGWSWSVWNSAAGFDETLADEQLTAELAAGIPEFAFDAVLDPWPRCPQHGDHPLYADVREGRAVWLCRNGGTVRIPIGDLPPGARTELPDGSLVRALSVCS